MYCINLCINNRSVLESCLALNASLIEYEEKGSLKIEMFDDFKKFFDKIYDVMKPEITDDYTIEDFGEVRIRYNDKFYRVIVGTGHNNVFACLNFLPALAKETSHEEELKLAFEYTSGVINYFLGMNEDGMKEVLSIVVGENESSKYWLSVLNSLKNRGVQDILILCSDGLTGIKDAISTAFPKTEQQRCIVHMVRNTLKYVANKDMKAFAKDLKTIYTAADEEAARKQLESVTEKWSAQYPSAMNRWHENWDAISPIFKFSKEVRTAFYTTNAIESLNSCYRRLNKQRSVFPSSQALMKALYLGTFEIAKKWTMPIRNWGKVRGELEIMYPDRMLI